MSLPLSFTPANQTLMILLTFIHIWLLYQVVFLFSLWDNISATCLIPSPQLKESVWSFKLGSNPLTPFKRNLRVSPNVSRAVWRSSISARHSWVLFPALWWTFNLPHNSPLKLFTLCTPKGPQNRMWLLCLILPRTPHSQQSPLSKLNWRFQ